MSKNTYWIADPQGVLAPVEGVEERDRRVRLHGWTEAAEPQRQDFVWLRHEDPALGATAMTWEAAQLDAWAGRGWTPGAPAEPGTVPEPPAKSSPAKAPATSGENKEKVNA